MRKNTSIVASLLVFSLLLLVGFGGTGLNVTIELEKQYRPYTTGQVLIELENGWWRRTIKVDRIQLSIKNIQNFRFEVENYTLTLQAGHTVLIRANLTILEYSLGVFNFNLTIEYTQSSIFTFGSERMLSVEIGNITISG